MAVLVVTANVRNWGLPLGVGVVFLVGAGLAIGTHVVLALLTALLALIWLLLVVRRSRA